MDPRVIDILMEATDSQKTYVEARLIHDNMSRAAKAMGIHPSTPAKWRNLAELEEAVSLLRMDRLEATRMALESELLAAVKALSRGVRGKGAVSIAAARAILDRAGFAPQNRLDVTSKGQSLTPISFVEIVTPLDDS